MNSPLIRSLTLFTDRTKMPLSSYSVWFDAVMALQRSLLPYYQENMQLIVQALLSTHQSSLTAYFTTLSELKCCKQALLEAQIGRSQNYCVRCEEVIQAVKLQTMREQWNPYPQLYSQKSKNKREKYEQQQSTNKNSFQEHYDQMMRNRENINKLRGSNAENVLVECIEKMKEISDTHSKMAVVEIEKQQYFEKEINVCTKENIKKYLGLKEIMEKNKKKAELAQQRNYCRNEQVISKLQKKDLRDMEIQTNQIREFQMLQTTQNKLMMVEKEIKFLKISKNKLQEQIIQKLQNCRRTQLLNINITQRNKTLQHQSIVRSEEISKLKIQIKSLHNDLKNTEQTLINNNITQKQALISEFRKSNTVMKHIQTENAYSQTQYLVQSQKKKKQNIKKEQHSLSSGVKTMKPTIDIMKEEFKLKNVKRITIRQRIQNQHNPIILIDQKEYYKTESKSVKSIKKDDIQTNLCSTERVKPLFNIKENISQRKHNNNKNNKDNKENKDNKDSKENKKKLYTSMKFFKKIYNLGSMNKSLLNSRIEEKSFQQKQNVILKQQFRVFPIISTDVELFLNLNEAKAYEKKEGLWIQFERFIMVDNQFMHYAQQIETHFSILKKYHLESYCAYLSFLIKPFTFLSEITQTNLTSRHTYAVEIENIPSNFVRDIMRKLIKIHTILHNNCKHVQSFLKKIGFHQWNTP